MAESIHYLKKGWAKWYKHKKNANEKALDHFTRAVAHAQAAKAWAHFEDYDNAWVTKSDDSRKAGIACADEALQLVLSLTEVLDDYRVYWARGYAHLSHKENNTNDRHDLAFMAYEKAKLLSNDYQKVGYREDFDFELLAEMGNLLICMGKTTDAVSNLDTAIREETRLRRFYLEYLGWAYLENGQFKEAIDTLRSSRTKEDPFRIFLAAAYAKLGGQDNDTRADKIMTNIYGTATWKPKLKVHEKHMVDNWHYKDPQQVANLFDKLRDLN